LQLYIKDLLKEEVGWLLVKGMASCEVWLLQMLLAIADVVCLVVEGPRL
jgi:hypothetical protein